LPALVGTRQNAVLDPPRHSATFYGTPRNRRIDGTLPADFFSTPDPIFRVFRRCVCVVITTSSTRVVVSISYNNIDNFSMALKLAPTPILPHFWTLKKGLKNRPKIGPPKKRSRNDRKCVNNFTTRSIIDSIH